MRGIPVWSCESDWGTDLHLQSNFPQQDRFCFLTGDGKSLDVESDALQQQHAIGGSLVCFDERTVEATA